MNTLPFFVGFFFFFTDGGPIRFITKVIYSNPLAKSKRRFGQGRKIYLTDEIYQYVQPLNILKEMCV